MELSQSETTLLSWPLNVSYQFECSSEEISEIKDYLSEIITPRISCSIKSGCINVKRKSNESDRFLIEIVINCKSNRLEHDKHIRNGHDSSEFEEIKTKDSFKGTFESKDALFLRLDKIVMILKPLKISLSHAIAAAEKEIAQRSEPPGFLDTESKEFNGEESKRALQDALKDACTEASFQKVKFHEEMKSDVGLSNGIFKHVSTGKKWVGHSDSEEFMTSLKNCYKEIIATRFYAVLANNPQTVQVAVHKRLCKKKKSNLTSCFHVLRELHPELDQGIQTGIYEWDRGNQVRIAGRTFSEEGLGHILAVASLIQDLDPLGQHGTNIAFKVENHERKDYARTIKIASHQCFREESLDSENISGWRSLCGTLSFKYLPRRTQEEFRSTLKSILNINPNELEDYFVNVQALHERANPMDPEVPVNEIDCLKKEMLVLLEKRQKYLRDAAQKGLEHFQVRVTSNILEKAFTIPDPLHESTIRFIRKAMECYPKLKLECLEKIAESKNPNASKSSIVDSARAITILNYTNYNFSDMDLGGIKIPKALLHYGLFNNTDFTKANLDEVNFTGAWRNGAKDTNGRGFPAKSETSSSDRLPRYLLWGHQSGFAICAFSPDRRTIATVGHDGVIYIWDTNAGVPRKRLEGHQSYINCLAFSPAGNRLVSGSADKTVRIWDVEKQNMIYCNSDSQAFITYCSFTPDGKQIVFRDDNSQIFFWEFEKKASSVKFHLGVKHSYLGCIFSPTGGLFALTDKKVVDLATDKACYELDNTTATCRIRCSSFNSKGNLLVIGRDDKKIILWDLESRKEKKTLEGHKMAVTCCGFAMDDEFIISGSQDKTVRVWSVEKGTVCIFQEFAAQIASISILQGKQRSLFVVGGINGCVTLWELEYLRDDSADPKLGLKLRWASHQAAFLPKEK